MTAAAVRYGRLSPTARQEIKQTGTWIPGLTIAGYVRWNFPDGAWHGDTCGCPDDRCRDGYHHDPGDDCGCLDALLNQYVRHLNGDHRFCVLGCDGTR